jgi:uncharacterized protein YndB with AHSA1/START domain
MRRVFTAAPTAVFAACSEADALAQWWGPQGFTVPVLDFRPRVGQTYRIMMQPPQDRAFYLTGQFRQVDRPTVLAYTFVWEDPDPDDIENLVVLAFRDLGDTTEGLLTHAPFKTEARRALHRNGWADSFEKLQRLLTSSP